MSRRNRYKKWSEDMTILGTRAFYNDEGEVEAIYVHRGRKARRASARLEKLNWREMSEREKLHQ